MKRSHDLPFARGMIPPRRAGLNEYRRAIAYRRVNTEDRILLNLLELGGTFEEVVV